MALDWLTPEVYEQIKCRAQEGMGVRSIVVWVRDTYGKEVSRTTLRRYLSGERKPIVHRVQATETSEFTSPLVQFEADKKYITVKAERDYWKNLYHGSAKQTALVDRMVEVARNITQAIPETPVRYKPQKVHATSPQSIIAPLSDTHIGEFVDFEQMNGLNTYNMEVFNNRLCGWAGQLVNLTELRRTYAPVPKLYIPVLGDNISGDIHLELIKTNLDTVMGQMIRGAHLIAQAFMFLAQHFEEVHVPSVVGNHGRMTQKPPAKDIHISWDYMLMQWVAAFCRNQKNIKFEIPKGFMHVFNVEGRNILIMHGDSVKSWQGVPYYGINRAVAQLRQALQLRRGLEMEVEALKGDGANEKEFTKLFATYFDTVFMGHFHRHEELDIGTGNVIIAPCFPAGQVVTMEDGTRKGIEHVTVGERVVTHTGSVHPVSEVFRRSYSEGGLVNFRIGPSASRLRCTLEHPVLAVKSSLLSCPLHHGYAISPRCSEHTIPSLEWVPAKYLSPGDYVVVGKGRTDINVGLTEEYARFLGLFAAEGHYIKYKKVNGEQKFSGLVFSFHINEITLAEFVARVAKEKWGANVTFEERPKHKGRRVNIFGGYIAEEVFRWCGEYAGTKRLLKELVQAPVEVQRAFLVGWLQGDGNVSKTLYRGGRLVSGTTISADLAAQLFLMARNCGFTPSLYTMGKGGPRKHTAYTVGFHREDATYLAEQLGKPLPVVGVTHVPGVLHLDGQVLYQVTDVWREPFSGEVFNLEVEEDNSYLVNGVAVHNCMKGADEFAFAKLHTASRPSQVITYWHPKYGYISKDIVYLDRYNNVPSGFVDALPDVWVDTTSIR